MKKGFTLLELLIVIGILAILATAAVLVLNPAELLRQGRDAQRIADLDALKAALSLYVADVTSPMLGNTLNCYTYLAGASCAGAGTRHTSKTASTSITASRGVDGTGWIPVNFTTISSGSPIAVLPVDPTNSSNYFYDYIVPTAYPTTFKLDAVLESTKFNSKMANDGGIYNSGAYPGTLYEVGTSPGLVDN